MSVRVVESSKKQVPEAVRSENQVFLSKMVKQFRKLYSLFVTTTVLLLLVFLLPSSLSYKIAKMKPGEQKSLLS